MFTLNGLGLLAGTIRSQGCHNTQTRTVMSVAARSSAYDEEPVASTVIAQGQFLGLPVRRELLMRGEGRKTVRGGG